MLAKQSSHLGHLCNTGLLRAKLKEHFSHASSCSMRVEEQPTPGSDFAPFRPPKRPPDAMATPGLLVALPGPALGDPHAFHRAAGHRHEPDAPVDALLGRWKDRREARPVTWRETKTTPALRGAVWAGETTACGRLFERWVSRGECFLHLRFRGWETDGVPIFVGSVFVFFAEGTALLTPGTSKELMLLFGFWAEADRDRRR